MNISDRIYVLDFGKLIATVKCQLSDLERPHHFFEIESRKLVAARECVFADRNHAPGQRKRCKRFVITILERLVADREFVFRFACRQRKPHHFLQARAAIKRVVADRRDIVADRNFRKFPSAYKRIVCNLADRVGHSVLAFFQHGIIQNLRRHVLLRCFVDILVVNNAVRAFVIVAVFGIYGYGCKGCRRTPEYGGNIHVCKSFADMQRFHVAGSAPGNFAVRIAGHPRKRGVLEFHRSGAVHENFFKFRGSAECKSSEIAHVFGKRKRLKRSASVECALADFQIRVAFSAFERKRRQLGTIFKRRRADRYDSERHYEFRNRRIPVKRLVADLRYAVGQRHHAVFDSSRIVDKRFSVRA